MVVLKKSLRAISLGYILDGDHPPQRIILSFSNAAPSQRQQQGVLDAFADDAVKFETLSEDGQEEGRMSERNMWRTSQLSVFKASNIVQVLLETLKNLLGSLGICEDDDPFRAARFQVVD